MKDNIPLAVGTIVLTVLALSLGDAAIKALGSGARLGLWQLFVLRSALAVPVLLAAALAFAGWRRLLPRAPGWVALRGLMLAGMWVAYYASLPHLPFGAAAAAYYTLPLFIVAFAALFGGERVGRAQWAAAGLGFAGVALVLRPGGEAFSPWALLPLLAAVLYAAAMILTRTRCRAEHPATLALGLNAAFLVIGFAGLLLVPVSAEGGFLGLPWVGMGWEEWRTVSLLALVVLLAGVGSAIAYQSAPSAIVGSFDFAYVGFAVIWGIVFFGEWLDAVTLGGIALITAAGALALRRGPG